MFASRASSCMLGATLKDEAPEDEEVGLLGRDGWTGLSYLHWYPLDENSTKSLNPACQDVGAKVRLMSKEKSRSFPRDLKGTMETWLVVLIMTMRASVLGLAETYIYLCIYLCISLCIYECIYRANQTIIKQMNKDIDK